MMMRVRVSDPVMNDSGGDGDVHVMVDRGVSVND